VARRRCLAGRGPSSFSPLARRVLMAQARGNSLESVTYIRPLP
jgi:hypothetical protein